MFQTIIALIAMIPSRTEEAHQCLLQEDCGSDSWCDQCRIERSILEAVFSLLKGEEPQMNPQKWFEAAGGISANEEDFYAVRHDWFEQKERGIDWDW